MITLLALAVLASVPDGGVSLTAPVVRDGALPISFLDSVGGSCAYEPKGHVELLEVSTGKARQQSRAWSNVLGEVGEGDVVVTNHEVAGTSTLSVAVLKRSDLTETFSCGSKLLVAGRKFTWRTIDGHVTVEVEPRYTNGGAIRPLSARPPISVLELRLFSDHCTLLPAGALRDVAVHDLPAAITGLSADGVTLRTVTDGAVSLRGLRGKELMWTRVLEPASRPCLAP
jgi:hypothetical protein